MYKRMLQDIIPRGFTKQRVRQLLVGAAFILTAEAVYMWLQVDDWSFRQNTIMYNLPIALYCIFWFESLSQCRASVPLLCFIVDVCVVILSMLRGYSSFGILLFSGHTLFLVYTGIGWWTNRFVRYSALLICLQVMYWKFVIWGDWHSFLFGIFFALFALSLRRQLEGKAKKY